MPIPVTVHALAHRDASLVAVVSDQKTRVPLEPERTVEIAMRLLNRGITVTPCGHYGNVFRFMPPVTAPRNYALKATDTIIDVLRYYWRGTQVRFGRGSQT